MHTKATGRVKAGLLACFLVFSAAALPVLAAPPSQAAAGFRLPSILPLAKFGFMLLALTGGWDLPGAQAQFPGPAAMLLTGPTPLNLSSSGPVNTAITAAAQLAMGDANSSGLLPPWETLVPGPLGTLLATPSTAPISSMGLDPLMSEVGAYGYSSRADNYELNAAIHDLNGAELYAVGRILQGIGHQLTADSALAAGATDKNVSYALNSAGNNLLALGDFFQAAAALEAADAADDLIVGLSVKEQIRDADHPRAGAGAQLQSPSPAQDPLELAGIVHPGICYGTWQRIDNTMAQQLIMYKVSRAEFVKINVTTLNGKKRIQSEDEPGAVRCYVTSDLPDDGATAGQVNVTMLVDRSGGKTWALSFAFLRAKGTAVGKTTEEAVDVLVEQEGEKKAFVRVSEF